MSAPLIIILIAVAVLALAGGVLLLGGGISGLGLSPRAGVQGSIRAIVAAQRDPNTGRPRHEAHRASQLADAAKTAKVVEVRTSQVTLQKLLRFAQWKITPLMFRGAEVAISLFAFLIARGIFGIVLQLAALLIGPLFMNWLLLYCVHRRFAAFDRDYPPFLMSLVGLIKTGMNSLSAIDAAAMLRATVSVLRDFLIHLSPFQVEVRHYSNFYSGNSVIIFIQSLKKVGL